VDENIGVHNTDAANIADNAYGVFYGLLVRRLSGKQDVPAISTHHNVVIASPGDGCCRSSSNVLLDDGCLGSRSILEKEPKQD
jgi:hypothetical protein